MDFTTGYDDFGGVGMVGDWFVILRFCGCNHIGCAIGEGAGFEMFVGLWDGVVEVREGFKVYVVGRLGCCGQFSSFCVSVRVWVVVSLIDDKRGE